MITSANTQAALNDAALKGVFTLVYEGVPDATVGVGVAGKGCLLINTLAGTLFINQGTVAVPNWVAIT